MHRHGLYLQGLTGNKLFSQVHINLFACCLALLYPCLYPFGPSFTYRTVSCSGFKFSILQPNALSKLRLHFAFGIPALFPAFPKKR